MMSVSPVVETRGLVKRYGDQLAVAGVDLLVGPGEIYGLVGPNGAGKTTALRVITGALAPQAGSARVFGLEPSGADGEQVRRRCGVVAAKPALYDRLTGRDNLRYAAELFGLGRHADVEEAAARFDIDRSLDLRVAGYSTGMKTRLALARAVLHSPDLLLLDEPTAGLDPESSHAVLGLVREMAAEGATVVMSTHLLLEAEGLADQVVMMENGSTAMALLPLLSGEIRIKEVVLRGGQVVVEHWVASAAGRSVARSSLASAGTAYPASSCTTSPGTRVRASMSRGGPARTTLAWCTSRA